MEGDLVGGNPRSATLSSTDGWTKVVLRDSETAKLRATSVLFASNAWQRTVPLSRADIVLDADAELRDVEIDAAALARMAVDIQRWCSLPIGELANSTFQGDYPLAVKVGQVLTVSFDSGQRPGGVAVHVTASQERISVTVGFMADVTSCGEFAAGLNELLRHNNGTFRDAE